MEKRKLPTLNELLLSLQTLLVVLIIFTGSGFLAYDAEKLALLTVITLVLYFTNRNKVRSNHYTRNYIWITLLLLAYLVYNYTNSYDRSVSTPYMLRFVLFFVLMFVAIDLERIIGMYKLIQKVGVFVAIVYIVCYPFQGANGGLLQSYQYTAQTLSLSLGFFIPELFGDKAIKLKHLASIGIIFVAILVTGKRTFFVIPVVMIVIIAMLSGDYRKYKKLFLIVLLGMVGLVVLEFVAPTAVNSITRLLESFDDITMNSRSYFWAYAVMLWKSSPWFGIGFGCFPEHIATGGVDLANYGYIQAYAAHNIYYQMLAEIGVVGAALFSILFVMGIVNAIKALLVIKRSAETELMPLALVSLYCQAWFLIYGMTGNPLYMTSQLFVYFFGLMINIGIREKLCNVGILKVKRITMGTICFKDVLNPVEVLRVVIACLALVLCAVWVQYLSYNSTITYDFDKMVQKAEYLWDKGKYDLAVYQMNIYCSYEDEDMNAAIKLGSWYEELGEHEQALIWYQNATFADTPDKNADLMLTGADNVEFLSDMSEVESIKFEVSAKYTKDVQLSLYSENLLSGHETGAIEKYSVALSKNKDYHTSEWFPVDCEENYLTMYGGFNMADWQFMNKKGEIVAYITLDTSENPNLTYRELNATSIYNKHTATVEIPSDAAYARVTYLYDKKENSASIQDPVHIVYGRLIQADIDASHLTFSLPDLHQGDVIEYENGTWTLNSGEGMTQLELPEIDVMDKGSILCIKGTLLGRLTVDLKSRDVVTDGEYGIRWNTNETNSVCERLGDAKGLRFNYFINDNWANSGYNDFDNIYPWSDIRLCAIDTEGNITYSDEAGFKSDGSIGDIFVEIPSFYVKREQIDDYEYIWITASEREGYQMDPAFITKSGAQKHVYVAAYQSSTDGNGSIESKSGAIPLINMSVHDLRDLTSNKGENYNELDLSTLMMLQKLFMVETGVKNSQSLFAGVSLLNFFNADSAQCALESVNNSNSITITAQRRFDVGDAVTVVTREEWENFVNIPNVTQRIITNVKKVDKGYYIEFTGEPVEVVAGETYIYNIPRKNGAVDNVGYCTGVMENAFSGTESFKYRHIENLWGNGAVLLDGCYEENYRIYLEYPNGTKDVLAYTLPTQNNLPSSPGMVASETIVKGFGYDEENPLIMLPSTLGNGASFTNSFGDTFYMHTNLYSVNRRYLAYGGCWDVQNYVGLFNYRIHVKEDEATKENTSRMIYRKY